VPIIGAEPVVVKSEQPKIPKIPKMASTENAVRRLPNRECQPHLGGHPGAISAVNGIALFVFTGLKMMTSLTIVKDLKIKKREEEKYP
jgi:hypothetical protein